MKSISRLYQQENKELLHTIGLLNFSVGFDKSVVNFKDTDLFSFLENMQKYNFGQNYDDIFYIIETIKDAFKHISRHIHTQIRRTHKIMPLSYAKELDSKSIGWIARQNGLTIKQKLSNGKVLAVKRFNFLDTYENRVVKVVLKRLLEINQYIDSALYTQMARFIKNELECVNIKGAIITNNILLHHKYYSKFYKVYQWLNHLEDSISDFERFKNNILQINSELKKFIALYLLHKYTKARILPGTLEVTRKIRKDYALKYIESNLLELNIKDFMPNEKNLKNYTDKCEEKIKEKIDSNAKLKRSDNIVHSIDCIKDNKNTAIFIDIFRIYPLLRLNNNNFTLPLLLKQGLQQKGENKFINANDTKIIRIDNFYTIIDALVNKNSTLLNVFLSDIRNFLGECNKFYYILPDYINLFDFNSTHGGVRSYFSGAFFIPKSILAAAKKLFLGEIKQNDTLLYFQKNNIGEVFATPILVAYNKELESCVSKGLYLAKYPTKKIPNILQQSNLMLEKCLQNGVKSLIKNDIKLYKNNEIVDIKSNIAKDTNNDIDEIKKLYKDYKKLFQNDFEVIQDDALENLKYYELLIQEKDKGLKLWGEKLPKLDIGIDDGIEVRKFNLVNESSELDSNKIYIEKKFEIPKGVKELYNPLFLEDEEIGYFMKLESNQMPFDENVECDLKLEYNFGNKHPYTLTFIPKTRRFNAMQATWSDKKPYIDICKFYPSYLPVKSINDLKNYPSKDGSKTSDLFDRVIRSIDKIDEILSADMIQASVYDTKNLTKGFCFAKDSKNDEIFCHNHNFIDKKEWDNIKNGSILYMQKNATHKGYEGQFISFFKDTIITKELKKVRMPMINIFNGHSLKDSDMPESFRIKISEFFNIIKRNFSNLTSVDKEFRDEFLFFSSLLGDCMPEGIYRYILDNTDSISDKHIIAYAIGNANMAWQEKLFNKVLNDEIDGKIRILSVCLWRSKNLVFKISQEQANSLIVKICKELGINKNKKSPFKLAKRLEILLALLRLREKNIDILDPDNNLTKDLLQNLEGIKIDLKSYLELEIQKSAEYKDMPDLIYALISFVRGINTRQIKITGVNENDE